MYIFSEASHTNYQFKTHWRPWRSVKPVLLATMASTKTKGRWNGWKAREKNFGYA